MSAFDPVRIGLVSTSDRAAGGVYADQGIPALQSWLGAALRNPIAMTTPATHIHVNRSGKVTGVKGPNSRFMGRGV